MSILSGAYDIRFQRLADLMRSNIESGRDLGAAVAVTVDGRPVVDVWGGWADRARRRPWMADTLVLVMSVTKALTGICGNRCIERGLLDPDAPVSAYWPEFAARGKAPVLVKHVFDHRAGLPEVPLELDRWGDWDGVCAALASSPPMWEPGTAHAYHAITYGWLVGELIRRVTGRRPNDVLQDEVCKPLGVEAWIGAPDTVHDRLAEVAPAQPIVMDRRWEIPAANGFSNARSVACVLGVLACGGRLGDVLLLDRQTIDDATADFVTGPWHGGESHAVLSKIRFARGFQLNSEYMHMGPNSRAFGHAGGGGAMAWADPDRRVSFAYTPNLYEMDVERLYERANEMSRCVVECLG
ncbi:MAG TPA: serine hydrolase domain-containing protein [Amycolatopsis sp.]|uniref:serine hydrolase domain-containing protein n=1 Tax=Amycolatopsis sp. TaxID=37632 RepID=UPI002B467B76|nr:serine hydrolase domain-containing protein [Amycolatopsis sp.]HKS46998.1 serine hydrolase domain-containing protein [Amycolatopsis sp.]